MKKITLLLFVLVSLAFTSYSQVQVGYGNVTTQKLPFDAALAYSYSQSIYLSSEINASGSISSIQWYYSGNGSLPNNQQLVIYMGTTSKTSFSTYTDWEPTSNLTQVYSGAITPNTPPGWVTINLTTSFNYNGTSNLVIAVDENQAGGASPSDRFYNSSVTGTRSIYYSNNTTNPDPASPPSAVNVVSYIPNIILGGISEACPTPVNLNISNINTTTANVSWQTLSTAPPGGSEYYVSTSNTAPTANTTPSGSVASGTTATITALLPSTTYYVWVRTNCGAGLYSNWSVSATFKTECTVVTSFNQNFDSVTTPNLPNCWTKILRGATISANANVKTEASANAVSQPNTAVLSNSGSSGVYDVILVSPQLSTLNTGIYRLKFTAKSNSNNQFIEIGTLNSNTATADFNSIGSYPINTTSTEFTVPFSYQGTDTYIGFRMQTTTTFTNDYLDNIVWELTPVCDDVTQISVPVVTQSSAIINWIAGANNTSWDIAIGESTVTDPSTLTYNTTTTSGIYNATNLTESTNYKVWVRSVCSVGGNGAWIGPVLFKTDCAPVANFNQNFDSTVVPSLPNCWGKIIRGISVSPGASVNTSSNNYYSSLNSLQLTNNSSAKNSGYDVIAVSPNLSTLSLGTYRLTFYARTGSATDNVGFEVGTLDTNTNLATFTSKETFQASGNVYKKFIIQFDAPSTDKYIGIRFDPANDTFKALFFDNIVWEISPLCPDVSNVLVPAVTTNGATITWTPGDNETQWEVAIAPSNVTDPNSATIYTSTTAGAYVASGLTDSTSYNVWVRSVCGTNKGAWSDPLVSFTTACIAIASFNETFDNIPGPNLPNCWSKILYNTAATAKIEVAATSNTISPPNAVVMSNFGSTGDYNEILVSPNLSTLKLGTYRLTFYVKGSDNNLLLEYGTLSSNTNTSTFNPLGTVVTTTSFVQHKINFDFYSGDDTYIGFRHKNSSYKVISLDNIVWELIPLCGDVNYVNVPNVTTNSATINWTAAGSETAWQVAVGNDLNTATIQSSSTTTFEATGLTAATSYNVWVRAVCSGGNGAWIGPVSFNTNCNAVASFFENFESVSFPDLPICWTKIIRNAAQDSGVAVSPYSPLSKPNDVTIYGAGSTAAADVILVTPNVSTLTLGTYHLKFYGAGSNPIQIGTLNNNSNTAVFTFVKEIQLGENGYPAYDVTIPASNDPYIGIRLKTGSDQTSSQYASLDNMSWENTLSTNEFDSANFSYFPNPVKDVLNISYINNITSVGIFNMLGQEVISKSIKGNLTKIDMSSLAKGTYLVRVTSDNMIKNIKVIKQ